MEALLSNHCAQSPASVWMASPGHALGHCKKNAACAVVSRSGGACTGGCGTSVQVVCEASGFVTLWSPSVMQAVLGNHCAQSPASVGVASPGHALGHCKVKWTLCSGQHVWWSLHWGLRHCCAGGLRGFRFSQILESLSDGGCSRQPLRTEPRQCVSGQSWAYPGPLQGQMMHSLQWSADLVEPALLGAAALLCSLLPVLSHSRLVLQ